MKQIAVRAGLLVILLLSAFSIDAHDGIEGEHDHDTIPYLRSNTGFNVPIPGGLWENQSTRDVALFVNESLEATIHVTAVRTLNDEEAIAQVLATFVDGALPEPTVNERIGLGSGTWTQQLFQIGDTSISTLALVRSDRTFVISFIEMSADYDAYQLAVRLPLTEAAEDEAADAAAEAQPGITLALQQLFGEDFDTEPATTTTLALLSGAWALNGYDTADSLKVLGFPFRDIVYTTIITGQDQAGLELADSFNTVFLGFFITPDNSRFLILGLAASGIILAALLASLWIRHRNVEKDLQLIEELTQDDADTG